MGVYVQSAGHNTWQRVNVHLTSAFTMEGTRWREQEVTRISRNHWESYRRTDFGPSSCRYLRGVVIRVLGGR